VFVSEKPPTVTVVICRIWDFVGRSKLEEGERSANY
jgi:hypothetical protein